MKGDDVAELANLNNMTERDLLVEIRTELIPIKQTIVKIEAHQDRTNGQVAELKIAHYEQKGALAMLRLMMTVTLAGIGAGAAVAGVILAIVAKGV